MPQKNQIRIQRDSSDIRIKNLKIKGIKKHIPRHAALQITKIKWKNTFFNRTDQEDVRRNHDFECQSRKI